jgi:hypothetical protein
MGTIDIPTTTGTDNAPATGIPPIYSPGKAIFWSVILNAAFGAYLHSANWKALNEPERARRSRNWFYGSLFLFFLVTCSRPLGNVPGSQVFSLAPLPSQAQWESNMTTRGRAQCERDKKAIGEWKARGDSSPSPMGYYDSEGVFWNIFLYTNDPYWQDCAQVNEQAYRGVPPPPEAALPDNKYGYVFGNNGNVAGYWIFTEGLRIDFEKTQDGDSKTATFLLSEKGSFCTDPTPVAWTVSAGVSREVAYCVLAQINAETMGHAHRQRQDVLLEHLYGHVDQWVDGTYRAPNPFPDVPAAAGMYYFQPFMAGLTMRTLIAWHTVAPDAAAKQRAYDAVKRLATFIKNKAWDPNSKAFWYENYGPTMDQLPPKPGAPDLNMLIIPAYAWLYSIDRDPAWITFADQAFEGGVAGAWLDGQKQFNQSYTWSVDYVKWRGASAATNRR